MFSTFCILLSAFRLLHFFVDRMVPARGAELLQLQPILVLLLVLCRSVVAVFAVTALQGNNFAHLF
jgi:hypothetical protein